MHNIALLPFLPEFRRSHALHLLENPAEIVGRAQAALVADVLQFPVREPQKLLGLGDALIKQIRADADPELLLKHPGQVKLADKKLLRQGIQGDFFRKMPVQIVPDGH